MNTLLHIKASALAAIRIMAFLEDLNTQGMPAKVDGVEFIPNTKPQVRRRVRSPQPLPTPVVTAIEGTPENPFVAQALAQSTPIRRPSAALLTPTGRNKVVYMLTEGHDSTITGIPRDVMEIISYHPNGVSAKQIQAMSGLKQKSVESAIHALRTKGVIESVAV